MGCVQAGRRELSQDGPEAESAKSTNTAIDKDIKQHSELIAIPPHITTPISWDSACEYIQNETFKKFNRGKENAINYQNFRNNIVSQYATGKHEVLHSEFSYV